MAEFYKKKMFNEIMEQKDSLNEYKILIKEHIPVSMLILDREKQEVYFSNDSFQREFSTPHQKVFDLLKLIKIAIRD